MYDGLRWVFCGDAGGRAGVGRRIVLLAVVALDKAFGFPVFEGEEEVIVDGLRGCQRLETADGLFRRFGSESGNSMERVM